MTGQPECWLTDDGSSGESIIAEERILTVEEYRDLVGDDHVPVCHGAPYHGRKHEPVRMDPVENRPYFRCGQCGSRASVGVKHE